VLKVTNEITTNYNLKIRDFKIPFFCYQESLIITIVRYAEVASIKEHLMDFHAFYITKTENRKMQLEVIK